MGPVDRLRYIASWKVNGRIDVDEAGYCTQVVGQHRREVDDDWALPELLVFGRSCESWWWHLSEYHRGDSFVHIFLQPMGGIKRRCLNILIVQTGRLGPR
jgi:hypothetical protein